MKTSEIYRNNFAVLFHKFFRISDGKNKEESKRIYDVWNAINALPDDIWCTAIDCTFDDIDKWMTEEEKKRRLKNECKKCK